MSLNEARPGPGPAAAAFDLEMQVLLQAARLHLDTLHRTSLAALLRREVDWEALVRRAARHKMLPLLSTHLRGFQELVPPGVHQRLALFSLGNARDVLRAVRELIELLARFEAESIVAVPYKGPILGAQLYQSAVLRPAGDLDVLVRPADVARARELLISMGYHPRYALSAGGASFMTRSRYSETFDHDSAAPVELHWAFTNRDIAFPLGLDDLLPNVEPVSVGGASFPGFGREDLLLVLSVHGSKHRWDRLEWLCGLAEAIRGATALDWDHLVDRAARLGVRRMVLLGVLLAHDLLQAPVPGTVIRTARQDPAVVHAASQVPGFLVEEAADEDAASLPTDLFRYELRERWRDRVRFVLYRVTTPSQPEHWSAIQLGPYTLPTHGFRRPFLVLKKLGPALRWSLRKRPTR